MDRGEKKGILLCVTVSILCLTILFSLLFLALWEYKVVVGVSLLVILLAGTFSVCVVALRGNTPRELPQASYQPLLKQENGYYDRFS